MKPSTPEPVRRTFQLRRHALLAALIVASSLGATSPGTAAAQDGPVEAPGHRTRLRFGASGVGGGFVGTMSGGAGGLALRVGAQLDDVFAIYVQAHALVGGFAPHPSDEAVAGFVFHELMLDFTIADVLQLGGGPSIDLVWGCTRENRVGTCSDIGPYFGGDFRAAVVLGQYGPERRGGLVLSVDVHPTWMSSDLATMLLLGIGGEIY